MRHYHVTLERQDRSVRQWSIWADQLTIGSHPRSALVLPSPIATHAAVLEHDGVLDLPIGRLLVHDDTPMRESLWAKARVRMTLARKLEWSEPGAQDRRRSLALAALSAFGLLGLVGMRFLGGHPPKVPDQPIPIEYIAMDLEQPPTPPPPPEPPQEMDRAVRETDHETTRPDPSPNGGPTEPTTVVPPHASPVDVMDHSVMGHLASLMESAVGEDMVDPNERNIVDVVLAGNAGRMRRGDGGQGPHGGGDDRMQEVAMATGIGYQGQHSAIGPGSDGGRRGPLHLNGGRPDGAIATRPRISAPTPQDVVLGGEAGSRSPESILRVIRGNLGGFQYTYQKYLRDHPELGGKISLKFTIAPSGSIVAIQLVSSNTGSSELDEEIKDKARRMAFDAIDQGNVTVTYAFVLDKQ